MEKRFILSSMILLTTIVLSGCHKNVWVRYQVQNRSTDTLYVQGKIMYLKPEKQVDSLFTVAPNSKQVVFVTIKYCWFGDCRVSFQNDKILDTLFIYKIAPDSGRIKIKREDWKLKRKKAVLNVNG